MVACIETVAFQGLETRPVETQVQISSGLPAFTLVGLPSKAVAESRERVRAALTSLGLSLPAKRVTVNLSPADIQKEGGHYDLPIALGVLLAMDILKPEELGHCVAMGELGLDGRLMPVTGVLPAAIGAHGRGKILVCPSACSEEVSLVGDIPLLAADSLLDLVHYFRDAKPLPPLQKRTMQHEDAVFYDMGDIKGQESIKRALEVAAAGGHNILMTGPPGVGKSMLARRLPDLMPPLTSKQALEVFMIHSVSGFFHKKEGVPTLRPPFRNPHHSASTPALIGGGSRAMPGEVSLAHHGVLFLDELPEFSRQSLEALRQPIETGEAVIARAQNHVTYPAQFQLIAAMNPCPCGFLSDPERACRRAPLCAEDYQKRISGPLLDRIDVHVEAPTLQPNDLINPGKRPSSASIIARIKDARQRQYQRNGSLLNARLDGEQLEQKAKPDAKGRKMLEAAIDRFRLSARGYHRVLRLARSLADLENSVDVKENHIAEALSWRIIPASHGHMKQGLR